MKDATVYRIMAAYFGHRFSENCRKRFGAWLCAPGQRDEKEEAMRDLWNGTESDRASYADADWLRLCREIARRESHWHRRMRTYLKYAAVMALMLLLGGLGGIGLMHRPVDDSMAGCFVPPGSGMEMLLPDSTRVHVCAGSMLVYPRSFGHRSSREVYLAGEARFDVAPDAEKPFVVRTACLDVKALGTRFVVQAYLDEHEVKATLEEGLVEVTINGDSSLILKPGEQLVYHREGASVVVRKVDLNKFRTHGSMSFEKASFGEIVHAVERRFGVHIQYASDRSPQGEYNVKFSSTETLAEVLSVLTELTGLEFVMRGDDICAK